jgi:uncharacterized protein
MNSLIEETSPYLRQHAHNPVEWYAWKPEVLARAKAEGKPILVSIGYSTCHWCHVMERESFEDVATAALMNAHFICIKIDREERPDLDQIYMEACQVITGSGGWPLNCFLTPDGRPFFAGTYYPPQPAYGRPSWQQVVQNMAAAYQTRRSVVEEQADKLMVLIANSHKTFLKAESPVFSPELDAESLEYQRIFNPTVTDNLFFNLKTRFDTEEGGFGGAPKFPGTLNIQFLLNYYFYSKNSTALEHAELSLCKMIQGGIYDQIGGGFARYATDNAWLIPHFEKMLYDNALIISSLVNVYKCTGKSIYRETLVETLDFVQREMQSPEGLFYAAYDADSEGVEGKFYVWQQAEIDAILGEESVLFCKFYGVSEHGNWEETNILNRPESFEAFASSENLDLTAFKESMSACRAKLYNKRFERPHPSRDGKVLLAWNALMVSSFAKAHEILPDNGYLATAENVLDTLLEKFVVAGQPLELHHTYSDGVKQYKAYLDDYAFLIEAFLDVYGAGFSEKYLNLALQYTEFVRAHFFDSEENLFYFTSASQTDILLRKKEVFDSVTPSGNSTMAKNLLQLAHFFDKNEYKALAVNMLSRIMGSVEQYPTSFGKWATVVLGLVYPSLEIAVVGSNAVEKGRGINAHFLPNKIMMASVVASDKFPLLKGRTHTSDDAYIYVCKNYVCALPQTEFSLSA